MTARRAMSLAGTPGGLLLVSIFSRETLSKSVQR
jgi:hypothetical protein